MDKKKVLRTAGLQSGKAYASLVQCVIDYVVEGKKTIFFCASKESKKNMENLAERMKVPKDAYLCAIGSKVPLGADLECDVGKRKSALKDFFDWDCNGIEKEKRGNSNGTMDNDTRQ